MSPSQSTGRAYLFKDVDPLEALMTPKAEHTMAMARGLFGIATGTQVRELYRPERGACPAPRLD
jgi:hypothetical protein